MLNLSNMTSNIYIDVIFEIVGAKTVRCIRDKCPIRAPNFTSRVPVVTSFCYQHQTETWKHILHGCRIDVLQKKIAQLVN
jgi:hypothetical protein